MQTLPECKGLIAAGHYVRVCLSVHACGTQRVESTTMFVPGALSPHAFAPRTHAHHFH